MFNLHADDRRKHESAILGKSDHKRGGRDGDVAGRKARQKKVNGEGEKLSRVPKRH